METKVRKVVRYISCQYDRFCEWLEDERDSNYVNYSNYGEPYIKHTPDNAEYSPHPGMKGRDVRSSCEDTVRQEFKYCDGVKEDNV